MSDNSWPAYFRKIREEREAAQTEVDERPTTATIVQPATLVEDWTEAPQGLRTWANRLVKAGWEVKMGHSAARWPDTYAKNGNIKKAAHLSECRWINAVRDGQYVTISYYLVDGEVQSANTSRQVRGRWGLMSDKEMKEFTA